MQLVLVARLVLVVPLASEERRAGEGASAVAHRRTVAARESGHPAAFRRWVAARQFSAGQTAQVLREEGNR